jgi:hypothetical protein
VLAVAEAEVAVDQDFWCRTERGARALSRARAAVADAPAELTLAFEVEFLQLRRSYAVSLFGPAGRDPADDDLTESEALRRLGYHLGQDGETEQARQMWLARDSGAVEQARAVAGQVRRWARALGIGILDAGAAELCEPGTG